MQTAHFHDQDYEYYPWDTLGQDVFEISKKIIKDGNSFDRIIALAKGGLTFARSLVDFLEVPAISSIQVEFYNSIATTNEIPVITQSLPVSIKDERILIFDDIIDSGETMKLAVDYLKHHGAQSIKTAALITKPWATFEVDYAARSSEAWVIFPNEVRETITTLVGLWTKKGDTHQQIESQLHEIGFTKEEVALFANLR